MLTAAAARRAAARGDRLFIGRLDGRPAGRRRHRPAATPGGTPRRVPADPVVTVRVPDSLATLARGDGGLPADLPARAGDWPSVLARSPWSGGAGLPSAGGAGRLRRLWRRRVVQRAAVDLRSGPALAPPGPWWAGPSCSRAGPGRASTGRGRSHSTGTGAAGHAEVGVVFVDLLRGRSNRAGARDLPLESRREVGARPTRRARTLAAGWEADIADRLHRDGRRVCRFRAT